MSKPLKKPASERSKDKGPPAEPTDDTPVRGYAGEVKIEDTVVTFPDDPTTEVIEPEREHARHKERHWSESQVADPPASTTREGHDDWGNRVEATEREPTDIPMPPEWKGTESQWAALSPQKKEQFVADTKEAHRASQLYVPPTERR